MRLDVMGSSSIQAGYVKFRSAWEGPLAKNAEIPFYLERTTRRQAVTAASVLWIQCVYWLLPAVGFFPDFLARFF